MSKNLEQEYKLHIETEIPDLWARIESSLPEKNVTPVAEDTAKVVEFNNIKTKKKKKLNAKVVTIASGVMVAGLAGLIILPSLFNGSLRSNDAVSHREMAMDAVADSADESASEEKASNRKDKGSDDFFGLNIKNDTAAADAAPAEEMYEEAACETADAEAYYDYSDDISEADAGANSEANSEDLYADDNAVNAALNDASIDERALYFIRQYGSDGKLNFQDGELLRDIKEINANNGICITSDDILSAKEAVFDNGYTKSYGVNIEFADPSKWENITESALENGECIAICYNGKILSAPSVIAVIKDGHAAIDGLESMKEAKQLARRLNK